MDYEVFLMSRVREEDRKTGDNRRPRGRRHLHHRPVITAAAIIMVSVSFLINRRESDEQRL